MKKLVTYLLAATLSTVAVSAAQATTFKFMSSDGSGTANDMMDLEHGSYYGWSIAGDSAKSLEAELDKGFFIKSATLTYKNIYNWTKEPNDQLNTFLLSSPPPMPGSGKYTVGLYNSDGTPQGKTYYTYEYTSNGKTCTTTVTSKITRTGYTLKKSEFRQSQATVDGTGTKLSDNLWSRADQQSLDAINWGNGIDVTRIWDKEGDFANPWHDIDGPATKTNVVYNFDDELIRILTTYAGDGSFGFGMDPDCHYYNEGITFLVETEQTPVPEPGTLVLLGAGMFGMAVYGKRRKNKDA